MTIKLINLEQLPINDIHLLRDLNKHLKRGHRWIFADCFETHATTGIGLLKYKKDFIAIGIVQADTQLRFRLLTLMNEPFVFPHSVEKTLQKWSELTWDKAVQLRKNSFGVQTNCFRLINGEGDGFPGMVIDLYQNTAVIKHDHEVCEKFYYHKGIAEQILIDFPFIECVYLKRRNDLEDKGLNILGELKNEVIFKENDCFFASNIRDAAKTGFFLDQRDNRFLISRFTKNKSVLNLFSYTGGFSLFAAKGGASHVTSVDIAKPAIAAVNRNFEVNELSTKNDAIAEDAFVYIENNIRSKSKWDVVITDPPSFAPNQKSIDAAINAYTKVFSQSLSLVKGNGLFAASSCSSHLKHDAFLKVCEEAFSKTKKKGSIVYLGGQPFDHPYPIVMDELKYLKFALFRVD